MYKDYASEEDTLISFRSGFGDTVNTPIAYTGHKDSVLNIDERIRVTFYLVTPSASEKQIVETAKYCFGVDIMFVEIPERLQDILISNEI
jgi:hypothetical protein